MPVAGWVFWRSPALVYFFRDPERVSPCLQDCCRACRWYNCRGSPLQHDIVQPAGTLVSIFLSVFDVHINRAPMAGKVVDVRYQPGNFCRRFVPMPRN